MASKEALEQASRFSSDDREIRAIADALDTAHDEAIEEAARFVEEKNSPSVIQLHAGEMTAGELRTARAIVMFLLVGIRALKRRTGGGE